MTVVHHYLWWAPYSVLQQWAVILHRLLFPLLSLPLSPSWQRKKQEGLQGMATTEEIYLVRHWEKEEAGKAIPVRGRQMDVLCPRAACPQQFLLQLLPMMEWVGKWWDSMTEGQHRSPLDSFTGKREGKASFPPWPLASAPIYTEKQRDPGAYGITVFKCVFILALIKSTMHPTPPHHKHLRVQRLRCMVFSSNLPKHTYSSPTAVLGNSLFMVSSPLFLSIYIFPCLSPIRFDHHPQTPQTAFQPPPFTLKTRAAFENSYAPF